MKNLTKEKKRNLLLKSHGAIFNTFLGKWKDTWKLDNHTSYGRKIWMDNLS